MTQKEYTARPGESRESRYRVDDTGITYSGPSGEQVYLDWQQVGSIRAAGYQERLAVFNADDELVFGIDTRTDGFSELMKWVADHLHIDFVPADQPLRIAKSRQIRAFFIGAGLFTLVLGAVMQSTGPMALLGMLALFWLLFVRFVPQMIEIRAGGLTLFYFGGYRHLPWQTIHDIDLVAGDADQSSRQPVVRLHLENQSTVDLSLFNMDIVSVFCLLRYVWRTQKAV